LVSAVATANMRFMVSRFPFSRLPAMVTVIKDANPGTGN
jgi:hypothetical protein